MKKIYRTLLIIGLIIAALISAFYYLGLSQYLSLESIKTHASAFKQQVHDNYIGSVITFLVVFTTLIAFTLPVTGPMGILAGFLYGLYAGTIFSMIAIMIGTTVSFLVVRHTLSQVVRDQYREQLNSFNERMRQYGYTYLITLQLITVVPYFVINTLAALANVSLSTFMWTTAIGSLPVTVIYVFAGKQLYMIQTWRDIFSVHMLMLLGVLALVALMPIIINKIRRVE